MPGVTAKSTHEANLAPEFTPAAAAPSASKACVLELGASIGGDTVAGTGSGGGTKNTIRRMLSSALEGLKRDGFGSGCLVNGNH